MSQKITKQILKDTILSIRDPFYLSQLSQEMIATLPKNLASYLTKRLYLQYSYEGTYYEVEDLINDTIEYFFNAQEILEYIQQRYPSTTKVSVYTAVKRGHKLHDHIITKKESTI